MNMNTVTIKSKFVMTDAEWIAAGRPNWIVATSGKVSSDPELMRHLGYRDELKIVPGNKRLRKRIQISDCRRTIVLICGDYREIISLW